MPQRRRIVIENGRITAIYADGLVPYIERIQAQFRLSQEQTTLRRASHVEPDNEHRHGGNWLVDLTPVGGDVVYEDEQGEPFVTRQAAIDFELRWLDHWLKEQQDAGTITEERRVHCHQQ